MLPQPCARRSAEQRALWRLKAKSSCEYHLQSTQRKTQNAQNICLRVCTRGLKDQEKISHLKIFGLYQWARKDAGGLNILFGKVRGDTRATGKEGPFAVILLKDSGFLHHTVNWDEQNPRLNSLTDIALRFQKTSGHLITKASSGQGTATWSSKKTILVAKESHSPPFQNKHYLWPCGAESRPSEPGASSCQDLQHGAFILGSPESHRIFLCKEVCSLNPLGTQM